MADAAFFKIQQPFDGSARSAAAKEQIEDFERPEAIETLAPDLRDLWDWHLENQAGFAALPFAEQKRAFLFIRADKAVPELGIPPRRGRRSHAAYHAAGVPLLAWWSDQGLRVTANRGAGVAKEGAKQPQPSATVRYLAAEFACLAERYDAATMAAYHANAQSFISRGGSRLLALTADRALDVAFKVALAHNRQRPPIIR